MAPLDEDRRDWQGRMERCRELANLMRGDPGGAPLVAVAVEMEQQTQRWNELVAIAEEKQRHCKAMMAAIDAVLNRTRVELSLSRLRPNQAYSADDLREEARLCREEARGNENDISARRAFATRAMDLAMLSEALARKDHGL